MRGQERKNAWRTSILLPRPRTSRPRSLRSGQGRRRPQQASRKPPKRVRLLLAFNLFHTSQLNLPGRAPGGYSGMDRIAGRCDPCPNTFLFCSRITDRSKSLAWSAAWHSRTREPAPWRPSNIRAGTSIIRVYCQSGGEINDLYIRSMTSDRCSKRQADRSSRRRCAMDIT